MEKQQQRNEQKSLEQPSKPADTNGQNVDEYIAPKTTGEWIWDNNPHEDRPEEWKHK